MNFSLRCHLCGTGFPATALWVCDQCLGPLEVTYDYAAIARVVTRELIESRPHNLWRYREFLPIEKEPLTGLHSGFTPLVLAGVFYMAITVPLTHLVNYFDNRFRTGRRPVRVAVHDVSARGTGSARPRTVRRGWSSRWTRRCAASGSKRSSGRFGR